MIYNFFLGHTASTLSNLIGRSISDFESKLYELHKVELESDIISLIKTDNEGRFHRFGFYLPHYRNKFIEIGKTPSLHIDICEEVRKYKDSMKATNSPIVTYYSRESRKAHPNTKLKICKKCLSLLQAKTYLKITGNTFEEFILSIEENDNTKSKIADIDGYVLNWQQISRFYREAKKFTCEKCNFKLQDLSYSRFMQTHHKNSFDKLNNRRSNLQCLCVKCHSQVDDYHKQQFLTIENQILLAEFEDYKDKLAAPTSPQRNL